jgi:hypothetical protein
MSHRTFEEIQRFNQVWIWIVIVGVSLISVVQIPLVLLTSAGSEPMPTSSILVIIFSLVFVIGLNALFFFSRLITKIDSSGVGITFKPFINKQQLFMWEDVEKAYVRKYKPLWEYGGWGVRYRWNSRAYNTSGNVGLQLILKTGKKVLIGTQKSQELESYLKRYIFTNTELSKD